MPAAGNMWKTRGWGARWQRPEIVGKRVPLKAAAVSRGVWTLRPQRAETAVAWMESLKNERAGWLAGPFSSA